jgi:DNA polymerase III alpha subunit
MIIDKFGQMVFSDIDIIDHLMQGKDLSHPKKMLVDSTVNLDTASFILENIPSFIKYNDLADHSVEEFDHRCQSNWFMPDSYKNLDIAEYVLGLCNTQEELQRCGEELLLFQEKNLFDLLRYMVYLVDTMRENNMIWGVGRGSSVASYVLYLLGVHKINSLYYELDPAEFLR